MGPYQTESSYLMTLPTPNGPRHQRGTQNIFKIFLKVQDSPRSKHRTESLLVCVCMGFPRSLLVAVLSLAVASYNLGVYLKLLLGFHIPLVNLQRYVFLGHLFPAEMRKSTLLRANHTFLKINMSSQAFTLGLMVHLYFQAVDQALKRNF